MIKQGDRVCFVKNSKEIRGTVVQAGIRITIKADMGEWFCLEPDTPEWLSLEKLIIFKAHSLDFLRRLPKEERPSLR